MRKVSLRMNEEQKYQAIKEKKLNDKSPYETFSFFFGQAILDRLNVEYVNSNDIILNPAIINS